MSLVEEINFVRKNFGKFRGDDVGIGFWRMSKSFWVGNEKREDILGGGKKICKGMKL